MLEKAAVCLGIFTLIFFGYILAQLFLDVWRQEWEERKKKKGKNTTKGKKKMRVNNKKESIKFWCYVIISIAYILIGCYIGSTFLIIFPFIFITAIHFNEIFFVKVIKCFLKNKFAKTSSEKNKTKDIK